LAQGGTVAVDIDADGKVLLDIHQATPPSKASKTDVAPAEEI
jgi:ATP-dependent Clp protease ATP-binding subunit ClpA